MSLAPRAAALLGAVLLAGCSAAGGTLYLAPQTPQAAAGSATTVPAAVALAAARRVLLANDYALTAAGAADGRLTTALKPMQVLPHDADCGSHMSVDYLLEPATTARVGFVVTAADRFVAVRAVIAAVYAPGDGRQPVALPCTSRGGFEREILDAILGELARR